jgi:hypothetical protein
VAKAAVPMAAAMTVAVDLNSHDFMSGSPRCAPVMSMPPMTGVVCLESPGLGGPVHSGIRSMVPEWVISE